MLNFQEIQQAIYQWAKRESNIEVVWSNQNAPQPTYPFIALDVLSGPEPWGAFDEAQTSTSVAGFKLNFVGLRYLVISVQCFSHEIDNAYYDRNALAIATQLQSSLNQFDIFHPANISVMRLSPVTISNYRTDTAIVSRAGLDIMLCVSSERIETATWIERADVEGAYV